MLKAEGIGDGIGPGRVLYLDTQTGHRENSTYNQIFGRVPELDTVFFRADKHTQDLSSAVLLCPFVCSAG